MAEAFLCDGVRTPIGRYGGALAKVRTDDLAAVPERPLQNMCLRRVMWIAVAHSQHVALRRRARNEVGHRAGEANAAAVQERVQMGRVVQVDQYVIRAVRGQVAQGLH